MNRRHCDAAGDRIATSAWTALIGACACLCASASAARADALPAPPIPDKPVEAQFKDAPPEWRDYLIRARIAQRIADPLQRCLAYPDLPRSHWPAGHAQAHCRQHWTPVLGLADVSGYLQRGDILGLRQKIDAYQARHRARIDFSEEVHTFFQQFQDDGTQVDAITTQWLQLAPDDAYAVLARAEFLGQKAQSARGGKFIGETSRESIRGMAAWVDQAVPLFERAGKLDAGLIDAQIGQMYMGRLDSRSGLENAAFARGNAIDPACSELAREHLVSLLPRWGGSYEAMLAYTHSLAAHLGTQPLLANQMAYPFTDRASVLMRAERYTAETADLLAVATDMASSESALKDAGTVAMLRTDDKRDRGAALALFLQEARMHRADAWTNRNIGNWLVRSEPEWSLAVLQQAAADEPGNAWGEYLLGAANYNVKRFDDAERHYRIALEDGEQRQASLRELSSMWLYDAGLAPKPAAVKAAPYLERLIAEYPDDGRARLYHLDLSGRLHGKIEDSEVRTFLKVADRTDPQQKKVVDSIEEAMRHPVMVDGRKASSSGGK